MAQSFALSGFPEVERFSLSATPNNATEVIIKTGTKKVTVQFIASNGKLAFTGTDAAAIGTEFITVLADSPLEFEVPANCDSIFVASAVASITCEVVIENR